MIHLQKIIKGILLSFVFVILVGFVFWGMQWFSASLASLLINKGGFFTSSLESSIDSASASVTNIPVVNKNALPYRNWQVEDLSIQAESAISLEVEPGSVNQLGQEKILFKKNEQKKLPIASLTKLMTALVVLDNYDLSQKVTIDKQAMNQQGEQGVLKLGQVLSVKDLLYISLMESSNRAAYALSEVAGTDHFITMMNDDAVKLNLADTHFQDATGLSEASYSTAKDLSKLSEYLFENYPLFDEIISLKEYNVYLPDGSLHHTLENTNSFLGEYNIIGGKTGYTNEALGCFMIIQHSATQGNYLITILLRSQDRFLEMKNIIDWVNNAYQW